MLSNGLEDSAKDTTRKKTETGAGGEDTDGENVVEHCVDHSKEGHDECQKPSEEVDGVVDSDVEHGGQLPIVSFGRE